MAARRMSRGDGLEALADGVPNADSPYARSSIMPVGMRFPGACGQGKSAECRSSSHPINSGGELARIVGANDGERRVSGADGAKPGEAAAALTLAGLHEPLVGSGSGRRSRRSGQFTVVEDGIAGVEQPTIGRSDGHAAMTSGVARQRDEKDVRAEAIKLGGGKAEPVLGKRGVSAPAPFLTSGSRAPPLGRTVATGGDETFANAGGISFQRGKMNCGAGEIDEARRVVEIQVGHDDVADVAGVVAENAKLSDSSFRRVKPNTIDGAEERAERAGGLGWIDGYSTRVD